MPDYNHGAPDVQDLHARLVTFERSTPDSNANANTNGDKHGGNPAAHAIHAQRRARPSIDSALMPPFTKSATVSTTDTAGTCSTSSSSAAAYGYGYGLRAHPSSHSHAETVGVAPGSFSKPRVHSRSRSHQRDGQYAGSRSRSAETAPQQEFKYYGRHGNQWLFNDFSVTDAVARGFRRVFSSGRGGGGEGEDAGRTRDWYEDRER